MYVRVKRLKTTIFLETEPQETGIELKAKLQKLLDGKDPDSMKLVLISKNLELEDARRLADLKVQNDDVLGLCYKKDPQQIGEGESIWEELSITEFPEKNE